MGQEDHAPHEDEAFKITIAKFTHLEHHNLHICRFQEQNVIYLEHTCHQGVYDSSPEKQNNQYYSLSPNDLTKKYYMPPSFSYLTHTIVKI